ncbi:hypothetical protein JTE90_006345 [Oedothorax gibbosus]|uniref:BTB domain-containing protein n=1 Tax=Oedothorax gibbosus TaxID=931172 RepID=A0AAV6VYH1_9ARAC|nr:hypothetical protein JTE90_006345 [Oedothorax gibbosus]
MSLSSSVSVVGVGAGHHLFFSERDSDVSVRVEWDGGAVRFPSHALVLGTMSDVFRTMLDTDMLERREKMITITDSSPRTVKHFLRYLYTGLVEFTTWEDASSILQISHKYSVQPLTLLAESFLSNALSLSNVCALLDLARTYSLSTLRRQALVFLLDTGFVASASEGFFELKPTSLDLVLSNERFNAEDEGSVLSVLREWAVCECSRRCVPLSETNVLGAMEPFLKYIRWTQIPESQRTFVPRQLVDKHRNPQLDPRRPFHVPPAIQYHVSLVKFVVELGAYHSSYENRGSHLTCLKFGVSNHAFLVGFRIIGLFRISSCLFPGPSCLALSKEDNKVFLQFNLNSLTWTKGSTVGRDAWREMIAYLPFPVRIDPFGTYNLSIRYSGRGKELLTAKWPRTRLDSEVVNTDLGVINFRAYGPCFGVTQLFLLPAPPYRSVCNDD